MRSLYESICTISAELNKISIEGIPSKIKDFKYITTFNKKKSSIENFIVSKKDQTFFLGC